MIDMQKTDELQSFAIKVADGVDHMHQNEHRLRNHCKDDVHRFCERFRFTFWVTSFVVVLSACNRPSPMLVVPVTLGSYSIATKIYGWLSRASCDDVIESFQNRGLDLCLIILVLHLMDLLPDFFGNAEALFQELFIRCVFVCRLPGIFFED